MAKKSNGSNPTPAGDKRVPDEWLTLAKARAAERGFHTDAALAAAVGLSGMSITRLWRNQAKAKTIAAVARTLEIIDPLRPLAERDDKEWVLIGQQLRERYPAFYSRVMRMCRSFIAYMQEYQAFRHEARIPSLGGGDDVDEDDDATDE